MTIASPTILPARYLPSLAALSGVAAIAIGAAAVHGVTNPLAKMLLQTGVQFQLPHAIAIFALLGWRDTQTVRRGAWAVLAGSLIFAGSLDALALGSPRWVGAITPVGGTAMLLGWLWLALAPFLPPRRD